MPLRPYLIEDFTGFPRVVNPFRGAGYITLFLFTVSETCTFMYVTEKLKT